MTTIQCTPTQPQLIAVSRLEKSPLNARRTNVTMGMEELKASLLAHGLLQNLVVTDTGDGSYRVIAGGRRLEAIHSLQAEGKLPEDFAVPWQIVGSRTESCKNEAQIQSTGWVVEIRGQLEICQVMRVSTTRFTGGTGRDRPPIGAS